MDDAMILPCGHSFGSGGMQHVMRMVSNFKSCYCKISFISPSPINYCCFLN